MTALAYRPANPDAHPVQRIFSRMTDWQRARDKRIKYVRRALAYRVAARQRRGTHLGNMIARDLSALLREHVAYMRNAERSLRARFPDGPVNPATIRPSFTSGIPVEPEDIGSVADVLAGCGL